MPRSKGDKVGQKKRQDVLRSYGKQITFEQQQKIHIMGAIFNGDGNFGSNSSNIVTYLLPEIFKEAATHAGKSVRFPANALRYESWYDDKKKRWKGGFLTSSDDADVEKAYKKIQGGAWESGYAQEQEKSVETIQSIRDAISELSRPQPAFHMYLLPVSVPGHFNSCVIVQGPDGRARGFWFEPHNLYSIESARSVGVSDDFLPYGLVQEEFTRMFGIELESSECKFDAQGGEDSMCQSWSIWFLYLMAGGMSYKDAQTFIGYNNSAGLYAWFEMVEKIPFKAFRTSRRSTTEIFSGSLLYAAPGKVSGAPNRKESTSIINNENMPANLQDVLAHHHTDPTRADFLYSIEGNLQSMTKTPTYAPWATKSTAGTGTGMFTDRTVF